GKSRLLHAADQACWRGAGRGAVRRLHARRGLPAPGHRPRHDRELLARPDGGPHAAGDRLRIRRRARCFNRRDLPHVPRQDLTLYEQAASERLFSTLSYAVFATPAAIVVIWVVWRVLAWCLFLGRGQAPQLFARNTSATLSHVFLFCVALPLVFVP